MPNECTCQTYPTDHCGCGETSSTNVCQHGQLARSCEICDRDREIDRLKGEIETARDIFDKLNHEIGGCSWCDADFQATENQHRTDCRLATWLERNKK